MPTCTGREIHHNYKTSKRPPCKHPFCWQCEAISLPPRSSDHWLCHRCGNLNVYNLQQYAKDMRRRIINRRMKCYPEMSGGCVYVAI